MTVVSNENVTERSGGARLLLACPTASPGPFRSAASPFLSVLKRLFRWQRVRPPIKPPKRYTSLCATAADWSAHRQLANEPVVEDSARWLRAVVDRGSGHHPTCDALCPLPPSSRSNASRAGTGCSRPTSAHRARCLLRSALAFPAGGLRNSDAPACRFSAPRCGYHSSDTVESARAAHR